MLHWSTGKKNNSKSEGTLTVKTAHLTIVAKVDLWKPSIGQTIVKMFAILEITLKTQIWC